MVRKMLLPNSAVKSSHLTTVAVLLKWKTALWMIPHMFSLQVNNTRIVTSFDRYSIYNHHSLFS